LLSCCFFSQKSSAPTVQNGVLKKRAWGMLGNEKKSPKILDLNTPPPKEILSDENGYTQPFQ
jgi:hypothetical protein